MKSKVKIFLTLFVVATAIFGLQAQRGQGQQLTPEQRAERQTTMMTERLSLSPEQAQKVKAINVKYAEKQQTQRKEKMGEREKVRADMQKLQDERKAEIKAVLNKDQQVKFDQMQEQRGQGRSGKAGKGARADFNGDPETRAERMTQRMVEKLSLREDQIPKVKAINLDHAKKMQALKTDDAKKADKAQMDKLRKEHRTELKKVLDKTQFEKWNEKSPERSKERKSKGKFKQERIDR